MTTGTSSICWESTSASAPSGRSAFAESTAERTESVISSASLPKGQVTLADIDPAEEVVLTVSRSPTPSSAVSIGLVTDLLDDLG